MAKRGSSGLSFVCGVNKPTGITSHDVVNKVRRIFGERRVGHAGTLDPFASGVLLVLVGPAARLDRFFTNHSKSYVARIAFGAATDTDDIEGNVIREACVPQNFYDEDFARRALQGIVGPQRQIPPVYSAIKVGGKKACDEARAGNIINIEPRDIEIFGAELLCINQDTARGFIEWEVALDVSKGTYIRSIARDLGNSLNVPAHASALVRTTAGTLGLSECMTLEELEAAGTSCALDPVKLLGLRVLFVDDSYEIRVKNGQKLSPKMTLCENVSSDVMHDLCACRPSFCESTKSPVDGEFVSVALRNKLLAVYEFIASKNAYVPACVLSEGVVRGLAV
jgi:tRNA pseudouridine55 synthase